MGYPAQYNGEFFDSQTEAAWAAYFDAAGIEWEREPETFELAPGFVYTPDFYVGQWDSYMEVKNGNASLDTCKKLQILSGKLGRASILANGKPHNLSLYIYGPESIHNEVRPDVYVFGEDFTITGQKLFKPADLRDRSPALRHFWGLWNQSREGWTTDIDPDVRQKSKDRKHELSNDPTTLYDTPSKS